MNTKTTIQNEMKRRTDFIEDQEFRTLCAKICQENGISEESWNKNKVYYMLFFANMCCKMENELTINN